ncbi:hypothetical protein ACFVDI_04915 [Nocardioides sp. NPDC057767]|uniref:hypothetical protein n=1 Tax=unclassified Nocardioides TaxID=2615069 RepID=UPI0033234A97
MEITDPDQPPNGAEVMRRLIALQTSATDSTLPRRLREAEVIETYDRCQGYAIMGMASLVARRAKMAIHHAKAEKLPLDELRRSLPSQTPVEVIEPVLNLCWIYNMAPEGTAECGNIINALTTSGRGFNAFVALCHLANETASMLVQFDPTLLTKVDLLRREALEFEEGQDTV